MLASLRFRNFRSFREEAELSLVAVPSDKGLQNSLIQASEKGRTRLLPAVAIYGANAAGKTNVLRAFGFVAHAVAASQANWSPTRKVLTERYRGKGGADPASFEVEMFLDGVRYRYGFSATDESFVDEWLYSYPLGRPRSLFQRTAGKNKTAKVSFGNGFEGTTSYLNSITQRVRPNSLFLAAAAQDNHSVALLIQKFLAGSMRSTVVTDVKDSRRATLTSAMASNSSTEKAVLLAILELADSTIEDVVIEPRDGKGWHDLAEKERPGFFDDENRYDVSFKIKDGDSSFVIPFQEQSEGVKKLYSLAGEVLSCLGSHRLLLLDEIETSIHPHLARFLVDLFENRDVNRFMSQLIFTTHDTNLLDQSLLRRDQIWFVEREGCGSRLYSLVDFSPRKDADLERGYLRGRYGAIPISSLAPNWLPADFTIAA